MEESQQSLSKIAKWILNQFIPESANWKIDIVNGFSGSDLKEAVKNGFTTDELVERIFNDELVDPEFYSEQDVKSKVYSAITELKNISEHNDWGFYIRSVPSQKLQAKQLENGMEPETSHIGEYKILIYDTGLLMQIARISEEPNEIIAQQRRWVDAVGKIDRSKGRSYHHTANNLLDAGREYTELLDTNGKLQLESGGQK